MSPYALVKDSVVCINLMPAVLYVCVFTLELGLFCVSFSIGKPHILLENFTYLFLYGHRLFFFFL